MKYTIEYNDYGPSYIVKMEADRYIMVNTEIEAVFEESLPILMKFGMWQDQEELPSQEICQKIDAVLKANGI